jgi:hypothetical protein
MSYQREFWHSRSSHRLGPSKSGTGEESERREAPPVEGLRSPGSSLSGKQLSMRVIAISSAIQFQSFNIVADNGVFA